MASICEGSGSRSSVSKGKNNTCISDMLELLNLTLFLKLDNENLLVTALQQVLADDSFKINSSHVIQARKSAESLLRWCMKSEITIYWKNLLRK